MEEISEAHMDTDVSSTTEDMPDTLEVSGSNDDVEMFVIVEKLSEDEDNSSQNSKPLSPKTYPQKNMQEMPKPLLPGTTIESSELQKQLPRTYSKKNNQALSPCPTKPLEIGKVLEPKQILQSPVKALNQLSKETEVVIVLPEASVSCHTEETIDSSTKSLHQKSPDRVNLSGSEVIVVESLEKTSSPFTTDHAQDSLKSSSHKEIQYQETDTILEEPQIKENQPPENSNIEKIAKATETVEENRNDSIDISQENVTQDNKNDTKQETKSSTIEGIQNDLVKDHSVSCPLATLIDQETSNDSQTTDTNSDILEKEHNRSISRELKSLIKSAKESKIISECTQLTSKTRKSRTPLESLNSSTPVPVEAEKAEKIQEKRRNSDNSQLSNCSEKSDKNNVKRSMRSQNPEFVNKVKQFLNSVTSKGQKEIDEGTDEEKDRKTKDQKNESLPTSPKKRKVVETTVQEKPTKLSSDPYCWRCHWEVDMTTSNEKVQPPMNCTVCPRAYHFKCLSGAERNKINTLKKGWLCPECMGVLQAESSETRSSAMKKISLGTLCELLKHAVDRLLTLNGVEPFVHPVDNTVFPDYEKYVVHPMDLTMIRENITAGLYGSTESFLADAQWILHNSIIFNTCEQNFVQSKLTAAARTLMRSCRAEMGEIEACPECYAAAHANRPTWFTDVCSTPHVLLWAKLKGFPYWPAKAMSINNAGLVDVRFFGAHDRAWVPAKDCYLYSEKDPNNFRTKRQDILDSMQEAEQHIRNISRKYGKFVYPPFRTQFDPSKLTQQLKLMIPSFEGEVSPTKYKQSNTSPAAVKEKTKSNSKSSKGSQHDSYTSESEESTISRKIAEELEITVDDRRTSKEQDKAMEVDKQASKKEAASRKRRRSDLEEAVITIMETSESNEKKRRVDENNENSKRNSLKSTTGSEMNSSENQAPSIEKVNTIPKNVLVSQDAEKNLETRSVTPIKLVISTSNTNKYVSKSSVKAMPEKVTPLRIKFTKSETPKKDKVEKAKSTRRRSSKSNKSLNDSSTNKSLNVSINDKSLETSIGDKTLNTSVSESLNISTSSKSSLSRTPGTSKSEKRLERRRNSDKVKSKDSNDPSQKNNSNKSTSGKLSKSADTSKLTKEQQKFDENMSLAALARAAKNKAADNNLVGMPTISSVRSLSKTALSTSSSTKTNTDPKIIEVIIDSSNDSVASVESVKNTTESATKPPPKKSGNENSLVGRVGVRAFARMTSPSITDAVNKEVQIEIKPEPIDVDDDAARHSEKMDLMTAFKLRPVNPPRSLEMRVNKVFATNTIAHKPLVKPPEVRPRARKTFPQPKKPEDGRSELNGKNSMVYIPIQPPCTPGPVRGARLAPLSVTNGPSTSTPVSRCLTVTTTSTNTIVNAASAPGISKNLQNLSSTASNQIAVLNTSGSATSTAITNLGQLPSITQLSNVGLLSKVNQVNTVGQVPTNVHTVPLITSVNGQWTFSLQPIMSVGGDNEISSPIVNGLTDGTIASPSLIPLVQTPVVASKQTPMLIPASSSHVLQQSPIITTGSVFNTPSLSTATSTNVQNRTVDTAATPGEPPRLQHRPTLMNPFDEQASFGSSVPTPSSAGRLTEKLNQNAVKLADFFRTLLVDSLDKINEPSAQVTSLKLQLENLRWQHRQELEELKHNHELTLMEMRSSFDKEKARLVAEVRSAAQADHETAVNLFKSKLWCKRCGQEAHYYCCWNTAYCDLECQRAHWLQSHFSECLQHKPNNGEENPNGSGVPPEPRFQRKSGPARKMPTVQAAPEIVTGSKGPAPRVVVQEPQPPQKIVIGVEKDQSDNSSVKCLGPFKAATSKAPTLVKSKQYCVVPYCKNRTTNSPKKLFIHVPREQEVRKQWLELAFIDWKAFSPNTTMYFCQDHFDLPITEDNSNKVVATSGGYLIVGASANPAPAMASTSRRAHTIQYYT